FSPRNFLEGKGFDPWWCDVARRLIAPSPAPSSRALPGELGEEARHTTVASLKRLLADPLRTFIRRRLGIDLDTVQVEPDTEPFALQGLDRYLLEERLLAAWFEGRALSEEALRAEGLLPHGGPGSLAFLKAKEGIEALVEGVELGEKRILPLDVDAKDRKGRVWHLGGRLVLWGNTLFRVRPASLGGKDVLRLWIEYLLWCLAEEGEGSACHRGKKGAFHIDRKLPGDEAADRLAVILDLAWEVLHHPLPLPPKTAWAWARSWHKSKDQEKACKEAGRVFENGQHHDGEASDPYVSLFMRDREHPPYLDEAFRTWVSEIFGPPLELGRLS
ncbi:MAG: hypothetical protein D6819_00700, partial [Gammaproteobacteria bacterium]